MFSQDDSNELNTLAEQISAAMHGFNFDPSIGVLMLDEVKDLDEAKQGIKSAFEKTDPEAARYVEVSAEDMFTQIQECFDYRGDEGSGLHLNTEQEKSLKAMQADFLARLRKFVHKDSTLIATNLEQGLPLYDTFWHFAFIILNKTGPSLFVFGAASD